MQSLTRNGRPLKCLLVGYNGKGNTGSEIRLMVAIRDVREAFGSETELTVMTVDRDRTASILLPDQQVRLEEMTFSPWRLTTTMWNLAKEHDVVLLVEGSTFKQDWSKWLLHIYLWAANCARWMGNHAIAYAVDVGQLSGVHAARTRIECEKMSLIITRTEMARQRLIELGVQREILVNSDLAFRYECRPTRFDSVRPVVGFAPIEFYQWPVRFRPWGKKEEMCHWPFAFTWNNARRAKSEEMYANWGRLARHAIEVHNADVRLIAMEDLDTAVCERILKDLGSVAQDRVSIITSCTTPPETMVASLRGLDALVTSRYHACVLSMGGAVPQMAISHDERLLSIYEEMELADRYLIHAYETNLSDRLIQTFDSMMQQRRRLSDWIEEKHASHFVPRCDQNVDDLRRWGQSVFTLSPNADPEAAIVTSGAR